MTNKVTNAFLCEFQERGFLYQATNLDGLDTYLNKQESPKAYIGFDCTASSLHVGSLIQIMILRLLQKHKIRPIILLGGGTTKIGDPSGKDKTRKILSHEEIEANKEKLAKIFYRFLDFDNEEIKPVFVDNDEWLNALGYIEFLRDVGKYFSVNQMLGYESVKIRLEREQNLSFTEFNYMILQAYDFTVLKQKYDCQLQLGGSDQWGNIVNGIELNRKINPGKEELYGVTTALLTTSDGKKMGKTEDGAVWLDEKLFSAYDYYQFWRNVSDADTVKFLKLFTDIDIPQLNEYAKLEGSELNPLKEKLAYEATKICHGEEAAKAAKETAVAVFAGGGVGDSLPKCIISKEEFVAGIQFSALLAKSGIVSSRGEGKRIIQGGGGKINDIQYKDPLELVNQNLLPDVKNEFKISAGKKKHAIIIIE